MVQQVIGIGASANDGTGDTARAMATKVNANFAEVYAQLVLLGAGVVTPALSAFAATLLDDLSADAALTTLGGSAHGKGVLTGATKAASRSAIDAAATTGATFTGLVGFGDGSHYLNLSGGLPILNWDANDYLAYDRTNNTLNVYIGGVLRFSLSASGANFVARPTLAGGGGLGVTLGTAVATTSGSTVEVTGIPSNARRVSLVFDQVSTNGTVDPLVQLGTALSVESASYAASGSLAVNGGIYAVSATNGFPILLDAATRTLNGEIVFTQTSSNRWVASGTLASGDAGVFSVAGAKSLAAALTRIALTTNSADVFDGGSITPTWEV